MSWVAVALSAYFILAIANLLDKFLIDNVLSSSRVYVFAACIMGLVIFLAAPWFLEWPGLLLFLLDLLAGIILALALWLLYEALRRGEASRILVIVGGTTPIFSLLFSLLFFKEHFTNNQWFGILTLSVGVLIIAFLPPSRSFLSRIMHKFRLFQKPNNGGLIVALISALLYSLYFINVKYAYSFQPFASAFIWTRLGSALFVSLFLINKKSRHEIFSSFNRKNPNKNKFLVVFSQAIGSIGFVLQNYAVSLGSVTMVNALQGVQYAILLIISAILAALSPRLLKENFSWPIILQKSIAVIIIMIGLYFLTI